MRLRRCRPGNSNNREIVGRCIHLLLSCIGLPLRVRVLCRVILFPPIPIRRLDSAQSGGQKMQKSGIKFLNVVPRTIVPLDSAVVFIVYVPYFSEFDNFLQCVFVGLCEVYFFFTLWGLFTNVQVLK